MKRIVVKTKNSTYPVILEHNIFPEISQYLNSIGISKRVFVLIDKNVESLHGRLIRKTLKDCGNKIFYFTIPAEERIKSEYTIKRIYTALAENNFGRDTVLIAIGGGIIGDIGGFIASTYMRGIQLMHIPTTIISACDSSVGGKTGYNFYNHKNLIGTFYPPKAVIIDNSFFNTLPKKEISSGMGEIIKYAFISDKDFFEFVNNNFNKLIELQKSVVIKTIIECVKIKAAVVQQDEFETGLRKILNFGHTFGHALESYFDWKLNHGNAVSAGITASLFLSFRMGLINNKKLTYLLKLPSQLKMKGKLAEFDNLKIIELMKLDKKTRNEKLKFVLIQDIGKIIVDAETTKSQINFALNEVKKFNSV